MEVTIVIQKMSRFFQLIPEPGREYRGSDGIYKAKRTK
jgi:hypothetical protein